jgi:DNA polymerase eta
VKERTATKSMLASKNITPYITSREGGYHWLGILAGELFVRLRDARDESGGLWPKTMVLSTRQGQSAIIGLVQSSLALNASDIVRETPRSRQIAFPYTRNLNSEYILKYARRVWDEVAEAMTRPTNVKLMKINNVC